MNFSRSIHFFKFKTKEELVSSLAMNLVSKLYETIGLSGTDLIEFQEKVLAAEQEIRGGTKEFMLLSLNRINIVIWKSSVVAYFDAPMPKKAWKNKENTIFLDDVKKDLADIVKYGCADIVVLPNKIAGWEPYVSRYIKMRAKFYNYSDTFGLVKDLSRDNFGGLYICRRNGFIRSIISHLFGK